MLKIGKLCMDCLERLCIRGGVTVCPHCDFETVESDFEIILILEEGK